MAYTPVQLFAPVQLTNSAAVYYTSSQIATRIDKLSFTNLDSAPHAVTVNLVPSGGSPTAANTITTAHALAAGETWNCPDAVGQILAIGGTLQMFADTGAKVTVAGAGTQIST